MTDTTGSGSIRAAVFRHSLFLASEQFIPMQAAALPCEVTMVARDAVRDPVEGLVTRSLREKGNVPVYRHMAGDHRPLASLLRSTDSDVLHAHFGVEGLYSLGAARALDLPHFTTFHGFDATRTTSSLALAGNVSWLGYAVGRRGLLRSETHIVCVSSHIRDAVVRMGADPDRTVVIGTGVDTSRLSPTPVPDSGTILHVARLVEKKGTEYLLRAFQSVLRALPGAKLRIQGEGPLRRHLEDVADQLGVAHATTFEGAVPHQTVVRAIKDSSLLCLPSVRAASGDEEGLGQVLLEAGACGRPVVASRHGGIVDCVRDGETGYLVEERNVGDLAERLIDVLANHAVASRMGAEGRALVVAEFDVTRQATKLVEAYDRALGGTWARP